MTAGKRQVAESQPFGCCGGLYCRIGRLVFVLAIRAVGDDGFNALCRQQGDILEAQWGDTKRRSRCRKSIITLSGPFYGSLFYEASVIEAHREPSANAAKPRRLSVLR